MGLGGSCLGSWNISSVPARFVTSHNHKKIVCLEPKRICHAQPLCTTPCMNTWHIGINMDLWYHVPWRHARNSSWIIQMLSWWSYAGPRSQVNYGKPSTIRTGGYMAGTCKISKVGTIFWEAVPLARVAKMSSKHCTCDSSQAVRNGRFSFILHSGQHKTWSLPLKSQWNPPCLEHNHPGPSTFIPKPDQQNHHHQTLTPRNPWWYGCFPTRQHP